MASGDPKHPIPFPFRELTDDEFDELVYLVAHELDIEVTKTRAPDGGLDTVKLKRDEPLVAPWGIQAKLHREHIKWPACRDSLDRAVNVWNARHVTFAFPRDLTAAQHKNFVKHLHARHPGVVVDWWGATKLTAVMTTAPGGRAIAKRFFHVEDPADLVDRATRAGGPLRTAQDLLAREGAIGDFLQSADPHFNFATIEGLKSDAQFPRTPGAAMRLEFGRGERRLIVDAIPRSRAALEQYGPKGKLAFEDAKRASALIEQLQARGGRATLGKAQVSFDRIPAPFDQILDTFEGVVSVRAHGEAPPLAARISAETDEGRAALDLDLIASEAEDDWDARLSGHRHGLELDLRFVWHQDEQRGQLRWSWTFTRPTGSARERADVVALVVALHGNGVLYITDREEQRPTLKHVIERAPIPDGLREYRDAYRDLADIQDFAGSSFGPPPDEFTAEDATTLAWCAYLIREGKVDGTFTSAKITTSAESLSQIRRSGSDIEIREQLFVSLFGREVHVAERFVKLPPMTVTDAIRRSDGAWEATLVPMTGPRVPILFEFRPPSR